jgi:DNA-directed RNA polymerase subunit beta'
LTLAVDQLKGEGKVFANADDVMMAHDAGVVDTHAKIKLRYSGALIDLEASAFPDNIIQTAPQTVHQHLIETTVGRVIFNSFFPNHPYVNGLMKKKGLTNLVFYWNNEFGRERTVELLDQLKSMGFLWAMKSGMSIGIDDMVVPPTKKSLLESAKNAVVEIEQQYAQGKYDGAERYNKILEIWRRATDDIANSMYGFMEVKAGEKKLNPIFVMADSGARGSRDQIKQLAGMRGLMAKTTGEIIETPITASFKEGLTVLQYFISTHGARKGLADTALKTADSGYLTRRLVDVAQDVIISQHDCGTLAGILVKAIIEDGKVHESLSDRIEGRVALDAIHHPKTHALLVGENEVITPKIARDIEESGIEEVEIRSVLTCEAAYGVCQLCYGKNLSTGNLVERGEAVGVIAAQSIGEPGTQLTMRTFHIGGTASTKEEQSTQVSIHGGVVEFHNIHSVKRANGDEICLSRKGHILVKDAHGRQEKFELVTGAVLKVHDGQVVGPNTLLMEWDPYSFLLLTEVGGEVALKNIIKDVTMVEDIDSSTSKSRKKIIPCASESLTPMVQIKDASGKVMASYNLPNDSLLVVEDGQEVSSGDVITKIPKDTTRQMDITGGLPRITELFEGRKPKEKAVISEIDGIVSYGKLKAGKQEIKVTSEYGVENVYAVPKGKYIHFSPGEPITAGEALIDGARSPHDILAVLGEQELQKFLLREIQEVYRRQGVKINDKHIEIIIRQMMRWVEIEDVGDTPFILGEKVDKFNFKRINEEMLTRDLEPAQGKPLLVGITKASLSTDSFISAASFQETTRVLTEAAIEGKLDYLRGLKENVIMGKLIPAGTGSRYYRNLELEEDDTEVVEEPDEEIIKSLRAVLPKDDFEDEPPMKSMAAMDLDDSDTEDELED